MKVLGKRFLEEYVPVHCKPSTAYEYQRSVKFFIQPRIGTRKVTEIQRSDIAELHHGMRETPYQANRILGVLSKMFNLAELWGLRPDGSNPCLHVKRYMEEKRERFLERGGVHPARPGSGSTLISTSASFGFRIPRRAAGPCRWRPRRCGC